MLLSQLLLNATEPKENVQGINNISHESIYKIVFERLTYSYLLLERD